MTHDINKTRGFAVLDIVVVETLYWLCADVCFDLRIYSYNAWVVVIDGINIQNVQNVLVWPYNMGLGWYDITKCLSFKGCNYIALNYNQLH